MDNLDTALRQAFSKVIDPKDVVEQFDGVVTINGIGKKKTRDGEKFIVNIVEGDNVAIWASCRGLARIVETLIAKAGSLDAANANLLTYGKRIKIRPKEKQGDGTTKWPVEYLGSVKLSVPIETDESDEGEHIDADTGEVTDVAPF